MKGSFGRLLTGIGLAAAVIGAASVATTSVLAYVPGATQSSTLNAGPLNTGGSVFPSSIVPGQAASYTSSYSFTQASATAGAPAQTTGNTNIGTMYQQWRHNALTDRWFYLYAGNQAFQGAAAGQAAASNAAASFAYYYYTREQGQKVFASAAAAGSTQGFGAPGTFVTYSPSAAATATDGGAVIYLDTAGTLPIANLLTMAASVPACSTSVSGRCSASLQSQVRWGLAQEAWPAGSASLLQAVESGTLTPGGTSTTGVIVPSNTSGAQTFYDPFGSNAAPITLTLANTASAQSATGVTNLGTTSSPGARNTGTTYTISQTITDTNGDLQQGSLVFVFTSGSNANQWFQVGWTNGDNQSNTINPSGTSTAATNGSSFYQSSFEGARTSSYNTVLGSSSPLTTQYLGSFTATATCNTGITSASSGSSVTGPGTGCTSETITYSLSFSSQARGNVNVFGNAGDYHAGTSGNVLVGALSVS